MKNGRQLLGTSLLAVLALTACGDDGSTTAAAGGGTSTSSTQSGATVAATGTGSGGAGASTTAATTASTTTTGSGGGGGGSGPRCGDGQLDDGEACDDANDVDGDGCNADCVLSGELLDTWDLGEDLTNPTLLVERDGGGFAVATAERLTFSSYQILLQFLDADGQLSASERFHGTADPNVEDALNFPWGLAALSGGDVAVSGALEDADGGSPPLAARVDPTGSRVWEVDGPGPVYSASVAVDADQRVYVGTANSETATLASYTSGGALRWSFPVADVRPGLSVEWAVGRPTGGVIVSGSFEPVGLPRVGFVGGFNADGDLLWSQEFTPDADAYPRDLEVAPDGTTYALWSTGGTFSVTRYEADGAPTWTLDDAGLPPDEPSMTQWGALTLHPEGGFVLVGSLTDPALPGELGAARFDEDGNRLWWRVTDVGGRLDAIVQDAIVSSDGQLGVAGHLFGGPPEYSSTLHVWWFTR